MKAPLKVFLFCLTSLFAIIFVVFYRYHILINTEESPDPASVATTSSQVVTSQEQAAAPASPATPPSKTEPGTASGADLINGGKLYADKTCALCHGSTGAADTPTGIAMKATNLIEGKYKHNSKNMEASAYVLDVIENGVAGTAMVSFKAQIPNEKDRKDLAAYVVSLTKGR